ncbi:hypothetical protein XELAEV_18039396mg [Xenopus laevis]|uniref:Uncharacterized protein n=1 Tax=Xenopus laevis TaxID=8355 RepID=A0A974C8U0_XENLA|nr:hypothetical protein XELAEV_18039396mg [Xenopus laevis]
MHQPERNVRQGLDCHEARYLVIVQSALTSVQSQQLSVLVFRGPLSTSIVSIQCITQHSFKEYLNKKPLL